MHLNLSSPKLSGNDSSLLKDKLESPPIFKISKTFW